LGRDPAEVAQAEKARPTGPPPVAGPVPKPSVRQPLSAELESELAAALGAKSLDDVMSAEVGQAATELEPKSRQQAKVVRVHGDSVFFSIGTAHEAVASLTQFETPPEPGTLVEVVVHGQSGEDGLYEVAVPGAAVEVDDWADITEGMVVEARITGSNTGGLECKINNLRGFIPASQIALYRVENLNEFLEQKLNCVVTEVNKRRKNLVLSRRAVLERENEAERKKRLESLEVGQVLEGVVRNLQAFGAFVELGDGLDGLIHISQMSWERIKHPSEVVSEGEKVRVRVEKFDPETGKIGLSLRSLTEHPWTNIEEKFPVDSVHDGVVTRLTKFGAFVRLAPGVEGLVHISELAHQRIAQPSNVVRQGEELQVKVLAVDADAQRIALSRKAVLQPPPEAEKKPEPVEEEAPREPVIRPQANMPLKGGVDRPSGGDQFGLKW
jgi:small subunit ribosomal protein S1